MRSFRQKFKNLGSFLTFPSKKITNNLPLYRPEVDRIWSRNKLLAFGPLFLMVWSFCKAATASWALVAFLGSREDTSLNKPGKQWLITLTWKVFWKKNRQISFVQKLWKSYCSPVVEFLRQGSTKGQLISERNFGFFSYSKKPTQFCTIFALFLEYGRIQNFLF